jgi:hypothetical protein
MSRLGQARPRRARWGWSRTVVCSGARRTAAGVGETGAMTETIKQPSTPAAALDPTEAVEDLLRSLKSHTEGLSSREAQRRLAQFGPNQLQRGEDVNWPRELARPLTHPLALLLWVAALLSFIVGSITVSVAVVLIIVLNAAVAFVQERHAENAVEALGRGVQPPLPAVSDRRRARDRRRGRVRPTVSSAAWHRRPSRTRHAAADPVPVHRLGRRRAPQVGDPDPVLAARVGRHTSTRRLTFAGPATNTDRGKHRRTPWPVPDGRVQQYPACCGVRGNQPTSSVGGATY